MPSGMRQQVGLSRQAMIPIPTASSYAKTIGCRLGLNGPSDFTTCVEWNSGSTPTIRSWDI